MSASSFIASALLGLRWQNKTTSPLDQRKLDERICDTLSRRSWDSRHVRARFFEEANSGVSGLLISTNVVKRRSPKRKSVIATSEPSAHTLALFLAAQARLGHALGQLDRCRVAIRLMHVGAELPSPHDALEVDEILRGIRRAPQQKGFAVDAEVHRLADICAATPS